MQPKRIKTTANIVVLSDDNILHCRIFAYLHLSCIYKLFFVSFSSETSSSEAAATYSHLVGVDSGSSRECSSAGSHSSGDADHLTTDLKSSHPGHVLHPHPGVDPTTPGLQVPTPGLQVTSPGLQQPTTSNSLQTPASSAMNAYQNAAAFGVQNAAFYPSATAQSPYGVLQQYPSTEGQWRTTFSITFIRQNSVGLHWNMDVRILNFYLSHLCI